MNQTGETVSEIDESAVWLQAFYRTLCHKTYFHIGYFCASFFVRFFLSEVLLRRGSDGCPLLRHQKPEPVSPCSGIRSDLPRNSGESLEAGINPRIPSTYAMTPALTMPFTVTFSTVLSSLTDAVCPMPAHRWLPRGITGYSHGDCLCRSRWL